MSVLKQSTWGFLRAFVSDLDPALLSGETTATILGWIRARSINHIASACSTFRSTALQGPEQWRALSQIEAFVKKNVSLCYPWKTEAAAVKAYDKAEAQCRITNRRLYHFYVHQDRLDPELSLQMGRACRFVESVLGDRKRFLDSIPGLFRYTSGATATRSRRESLPFQKVTKRVVCTRTALPLVEAMANYTGINLRQVAFVETNRVVVVPKNWKTGRTIAAEPDGNLPFQLAFDAYVKDRLRSKTGIDLSSQVRNQQYALSASLNGEHATVDFSMASDTVALEAAAWLFPTQWFEFLTAVRSRRGQYTPSKELLLSDPSTRGRTWHYAKLSSMGNGTTFCVETLMFAAIAYAVGSKTICVYGDDVVVDAGAYPAYCRLAKFLGFTVNLEKSYAAGPFRESCGEHYFQGRLVTPFYLRRWDKDLRKAEMCHVVNGLASIARPEGKLWEMLRTVVRERELPLTPWCEQSTAGVHIDVSSAYSQGLIRRRSGQAMYKCYQTQVPKEKLACRDIRPYLLWQLGTHQRVLALGSQMIESAWTPALHWALGEKVYEPDGGLECSSVPSIAEGYHRNWASFQPRTVAEHPPHLFWWAEYLLAP